MGPELLLAAVIATYVTGRSAADVMSIRRGNEPPSLTRGSRQHELASQWLGYRKAKLAYKMRRAGTKVLKPKRPHRFWQLAWAVWDDRMINAKAEHDRRVAERRDRTARIEADEAEPTPLQRFLEKRFERGFGAWDRAWERLDEWREKKAAERDGRTDDGQVEADESQAHDASSTNPQQEASEASDEAVDESVNPDPNGESKAESNGESSPESTPEDPSDTDAEATETGTTDDNNTRTNENEEDPVPANGSNGASAGGSTGGGEINSQRKLALAEQRIADLLDKLLGKAESIRASAEANRMDTDEISRGTEVLRTTQAGWASESTEHDQAATAATEVVKAHQGRMSDDLDYDVAN